LNKHILNELEGNLQEEFSSDQYNTVVKSYRIDPKHNVEAGDPYESFVRQLADAPSYNPTSLLEPSEPFSKLIDQVFAENDFECLIKRSSEKVREKNRAEIKHYLSSVIWNLYKIRQTSKNPYMRISKDNSSYTKGSRYNGANLGRRISQVIDHLAIKRLVEKFSGFNGRKGQFSYQTRIKPSDALCKHLDSLPDWLSEDYSIKEVIILKDGVTKKLVEYDDYEETSESNNTRNILTKLNAINSMSDIRIKGMNSNFYSFADKNNASKIVDIRNSFIYAVYHRQTSGEWLYGRMHGPWWQSVPGKHRTNIVINDNSTVCLDYSAQILNIVSSWEGIQLESDPYNIPHLRHYITPKKHRAITKACVMMMINCESRAKASQALSKWINGEEGKGKDAKLQHFDLINDYLDALEARYFGLMKHFYMSKGLMLFKQDSDLARDIIQVFVNQSICILPIHDGFIVEEKHKKLLRVTMHECWTARFGTRIDVKEE